MPSSLPGVPDFYSTIWRVLLQLSGEFEEEQERIRQARENLPPVETILGLDEMEVSEPRGQRARRCQC
jgi:hypothetical protein